MDWIQLDQDRIEWWAVVTGVLIPLQNFEVTTKDYEAV
jgi:hypothetical protein